MIYVGGHFILIHRLLEPVSAWLWLAFWLVWVVWGFITSRRRLVITRERGGLRLGWWMLLIWVIYKICTGSILPGYLPNGLYMIFIWLGNILGTYLWAGSLPAVIAGFLLEVFGLSLAIWARAHLGAFWSGQVVLREGHLVVDTGPYRLIRHPIYSGILLALIGTFLMSGWVLWLVILGVAAVNMTARLQSEECLLTRELGEEYVRYRSRTRMLIPWLL